MATRTITGPVQTALGDAITGTLNIRVKYPIIDGDGNMLLPTQETVTPIADGDFSVTLEEGTYIFAIKDSVEHLLWDFEATFEGGEDALTIGEVFSS